MHLQVLAVVLSPSAIQFSNAHLAKITISLFDFLPFSVPSRAVPEFHRLINFLLLNWFFLTNVSFGVDFSTVNAT